jgi:G:T-mismatch repair DNA endonuclease (very short patch repair protein)
MLKKDKLIKEKYKGIHPTCACGCGEETRYEAKLKDFCKYKHGHQSRLEGHWGDLKSEKRVKAISEARKKRFKSGEYDYIVDAIKKTRKDPELGKKISKGAKGIPKPKPEGFGFGRIHSKKTKSKMSDSAIKRIIETDQNHTSNLEDYFSTILDSLNIKYIRFFYAKDIKAFYDFYLPKYNIIIEVDGDFWHCNPNTKYAEPSYNTQRKNLKRDKQKTEWAQQNGFKLLRFWENDIKNDVKKVKQMLLECTQKN